MYVVLYFSKFVTTVPVLYSSEYVQGTGIWHTVESTLLISYKRKIIIEEDRLT